MKDRIALEELSSTKIKLTAQPSSEDVQRALEQALRQLGQEIDIPGFRKGKAPPEMIRERVNDTKLALEILDVLINLMFRQGIEAHEIVPVGRPEVELPEEEEAYQNLLSSEEEPNFVIEYTVEVRPEIEIEDYNKVNVEKPSVMVKDSEIDDAVENLFQEWKKQQQTDEDEGEEIVTASSLTEAQAKASQDRQSKQEKIASIDKDTPDDEWAQMVGETDLAGLRENVRAILLNTKRAEAERQLERRIFDYLIALAPDLEVPESMIEERLDFQEKQLRDQLEQAEMDLDDFLEKRDKSLEEVREDWQESIERQFKIEFILDYIARQEEIKTTEEELNQELEQIRRPEVREKFEEPMQKEYLKYMIRQSKTLNWLKEQVNSS